ncbi:double-strand break repair protein MRE11, putative [Plasmodium vivax]|uniref:Double-strand break repair protein MRE11, putative n=1 Tax=Plasmodium vivax TaxID=5855 RepID=A0A564ZQW9_PLAVI|nr:double-strand break repair protein MRE11, putative [Plasmodium vivax]
MHQGSGRSPNDDQANAEANRTKVLSLKSLYGRLHRTSELLLQEGKRHDDKRQEGKRQEGKRQEEGEQGELITAEDHREGFHSEEASPLGGKLGLRSSRRETQQKRRPRQTHGVKGTRGNANDIRRYFTQEGRSGSVRETPNGASFQASGESDVEAQRKTRLRDRAAKQRGDHRGDQCGDHIDDKADHQVDSQPDERSDALGDRLALPQVCIHNDQPLNLALKGGSLRGIPRKGEAQREPSGSSYRSGLWRESGNRESGNRESGNRESGNRESGNGEGKHPLGEGKGTKYNAVKGEEEKATFQHCTLEEIRKSLSKNEPDTLKILLCTDNHLGYKENNAVQKEDTFNSFEEILFVAKHLNVDLILNSGDLFHKNKISEYTLFKSMAIIRRYCHKVRGYEEAEGGASPDAAPPARGTHPRRVLLKEVHSSDYKWYGGDEQVHLGGGSTHSEGSHIGDGSHSEGSTHSGERIHGDRRPHSGERIHGDRRPHSGERSRCEGRPVREKVETAIPLFTMHGNHDYPYSCDYISPLDILHVGNLINYIGKSSLDRIVIKPVLLNKEETKIAIYAIGWIKDERLHRAFEEKKVKFMLPSDHACRINVLVLHQNRHMRCAHGNDFKNFIKESFIPSFVDLVIWGHEHFSKPYLEESSFCSFFSLQLGSSVRTSLCTNEYGDKHIGLLEIRKGRFRFLKIQLETVRPFELKEVRLASYNLNFSEESVLKRFLHEQVDAILEGFQLSLREQVKRYYLFRRAFLRKGHMGGSGPGKDHPGEDHTEGDDAGEDAAREDSAGEDAVEKNDPAGEDAADTNNTGGDDPLRGPALPRDVFTKRERLDEYFDAVVSEREVTHFLSSLQEEAFYSSTFIHVAFSTPSDTFDLLKIKKGVYEKPLIKLKVEYEDISIINTQLFGSTFASRVANPSEFLTFYRKKGKASGGARGAPTTGGVESTNVDHMHHVHHMDGMHHKDILNMGNINEYNKVFEILFNYCQLKEELSILKEKTIKETILNFMSNSNSSFNSDSTGTSDYGSLISMVDHWARSKVELLEGSLRDVPVESLTEEYLSEVVRSLPGGD